MKKLRVIAVVILLATSCRKSEDKYFRVSAVVLDWDSRVSIPNANVYASAPLLGSFPKDSALSDAVGRVTFLFSKQDGSIILKASKQGLLIPFYSFSFHPSTVSRTDTLFLARPSFLNLSTFRSTSYQPTDSIRIKVSNYPPFYMLGTSFSNIYEFMRPANAADTVMNLPMVYYPPPNQKAYIKWEIVRNGISIISRSDSTDLNRNATQNYTLNY